MVKGEGKSVSNPEEKLVIYPPLNLLIPEETGLKGMPPVDGACYIMIPYEKYPAIGCPDAWHEGSAWIECHQA